MHAPVREELLSLVYASTAAISQALSVWQPQMVKGFGLSDTQVGWLNAIPFAIATVAMVLWGKASDRSRGRVRFTVIPIALSAVALAFVPLAYALPVFLLVLSAVLVGTYAAKGPFWSLSTQWLSRREAVAGIAVINSLGSLAAFGGNWLVGGIKDRTGSFTLALMPLMALAAVSVLALIVAARAEHRSDIGAAPDQQELGV
ncbi:MFS transporter [Streptomyces sp. WG-D5]